ncbi:rhomboid family intramembrane serine protease [Cytobacillus sp. FJAT-54145]|uniref:Rhomboid family intramembrane serine protease n=1 Tax=Cytobacillus spartinae TaxID=3299023 RepID=A0ABW6KJI8_9BACI
MFTRTESLKEFMRYYPIVTAILFIHIILYALMVVPIFPNLWLMETLAGVNLYIVQGEVWRLVTPIFVHSGFPHMLFNSFSLVLFGPGLERMLGKKRFIILYLATGILANIATLFIQPLTYTHVGSSGSIFGLFGIYIAIVMFRKDLMSRENSRVILTIAVIGLIMTFVQSNINITAHVFGLIAGFLLGVLTFGKGQEMITTFQSISTRNRRYNRGSSPSFSPRFLLFGGIVLLAILGFLSR